jgi:hypothetical protein
MDHAGPARHTAATRNARRRTVTGAVLLALLASGCMTSKVEETRQVASPILADESIVLLKKPQLEGVGTEEAFLDCVQERLGGQLIHPEDGQESAASTARTPFKIYGEQEFTDALFPWFEPSTAPANADGLRVLLERPGVVPRLQQIGVRYVVALPAPSGPEAAVVSASAGGKKSPGTWRRSGTCRRRLRSVQSAPMSAAPRC